MVTTIPADILRLGACHGRLAPNSTDVTIVRDAGVSPAETLLDAQAVDLVISRAKVRMVSREFAPRLPDRVVAKLHPLHIEGRGRVLVDTDTPRLIREARQHLPEPLRLAGKRVLP